MHQLHALFSSLNRVETKRFRFTGTKHKEFHYYFSERKFVFFQIGNSICLYSDCFTPHFLLLLNIREGILILKFCSKGIFKLEITYFCSYWHGRKHVFYNSSRKLNQEDILGSNSQHSKLANTGRKLFIYHLFHQFFLHPFSSIFSVSTAAVSFVFLSLCIWFREKSPFPSINSSRKVCVSGPWCRLKHTMGSQLHVLAH